MSSLLSRILFGPRRKIRVLGLKLTRSPQCLHLQRVPIEGTNLDYNKWDRVKLELLQGAFQSSPGCLVGLSHLRVDKQDFIRASSIQMKYVLPDKSKLFLVHKDKWSRAELDGIANNSLCFRLNLLWMLPNIDKVMPFNEAEKIYQFLCSLYHLKSDSKITLDKGEWETVGCTYDEEITWTKPSPQRADLVVENLKKLCSKLEIELEET